MRMLSGEWLLPIIVGLLLVVAVFAAFAEPPQDPETSIDELSLQELEVVLWLEDQPGVRYVFRADNGRYTRSIRSYELSGEVVGVRETGQQREITVRSQRALLDRQDNVRLDTACIVSAEGNWGQFRGVTIEPGRLIRAEEVVRFDAHGVSASGRDFLADDTLSRFRIAQPEAEFRSGGGQEGDNGQAICSGIATGDTGTGPGR